LTASGATVLLLVWASSTSWAHTSIEKVTSLLNGSGAEITDRIPEKGP
jgi:hypothetical protein